MKKFFNRKSKLFLKFNRLGLAFFFFSLSLSLFVLEEFLISRKKIFLKTKASSNLSSTFLTINDFRFSYKDLINLYGDLQKIQLFSGGTVLSEFDDGSGRVYAGHLASFWAPPFYSDFGRDKANWESGFNLGLVFSDGQNCFAEQPTDLQSELAYWYPSKSVIKKNYDKVEVTGVKIPLPGERGFALKLTVKNKTNLPQNFKILFLGALPTFETLKEGITTNPNEWFYYNPWIWLIRRPSTAKNSDAGYLSDGTVVVRNMVSGGTKSGKTYQGFLAAGLDKPPFSWELSNSKQEVYSYFQSNCATGRLRNADYDNNQSGSVFGLVGDYTNLKPAGTTGDSKTVTLIVGLGENEDEAKALVNKYRNKDVEIEADNFWNQRIQRVLTFLPQFNSGDQDLNRVYKNTITTYLVNKWTIFGGETVGQSAGYGQSVAFFPWMTGTESFLSWADTQQWKEQLKRILSLGDDYFRRCRAVDLMSGDNLCDTFYAYDRVSLINGVYKYIAVSGNIGFLNETVGNKKVIDKLIYLAQVDEERLPADSLVKDYGHDWNLYELTRHALNCGWGGKYTGQVVSPNFERAEAYNQLGELLEELGDSRKTAFFDKARMLKEEINRKLWDGGQGWFKTINWWPACTSSSDPNCQRLSSPRVEYFYNIAPFFLLQYDDLLSEEQKNKILSYLNEFEGPNGLYSLSVRYKGERWCSDEVDWHGRGLYSGGVGAVLTGLFKSGDKERAYSILKKYNYLQGAPYFSQSFLGDYQKPGESKLSQAVAYFEGISLGQALIEGMFGVEPNLQMVKIVPKVPSALINLGEVSLSNIRVLGQLANLKINRTGSVVEFTVVPGIVPGYSREQFSFEFNWPGNMELKVKNLSPYTQYLITLAEGEQGKEFTFLVPTTDGNGDLSFSYNLKGKVVISGKKRESVSPTASLAPSPTATVIVATPTPTLVFGGLECQPRCFFGPSQCKYGVTPIPGYSCQINPACSGCYISTGTWCWAYCRNASGNPTPTSVTPTRVPTPTVLTPTRMAFTPTPTATVSLPTRVPTVISPTPSPSGNLVCQPRCFFGPSQCKYGVTPIPGYSCQINPACSGCYISTGTWCWAYCKVE